MDKFGGTMARFCNHWAAVQPWARAAAILHLTTARQGTGEAHHGPLRSSFKHKPKQSTSDVASWENRLKLSELASGSRPCVDQRF